MWTKNKVVMEDRIKTWGILIIVGTVLGFTAFLIARYAEINEAWGWVTGISVFLNFFLSGMVGNARNAAQRANDVMAAMYDKMQRSISPEPVYITQPAPNKTTFEIQEYPDEDHRPRPAKEAELIGREADERERREREEEYLRTRSRAGFTQGHHSPTLSVEAWYKDHTGQYRQRRR